MVLGGLAPELMPYLTGNMVHADPPRHTRLRKLALRALSARRVAALRPRIEAIADEPLTAIPDHADDGVVDLIEHLCYPLPIMVIFKLVGVPAEDKPQWWAWSHGFARASVRELNAVLSEVRGYLPALVERRGDSTGQRPPGLGVHHVRS